MIRTANLMNGVKMPLLDLGVFQVEAGKVVEKVASSALKTEYRSVDTAAIYHNESGVGTAIASASIPRKEIFITTKVWNTD